MTRSAHPRRPMGAILLAMTGLDPRGWEAALADAGAAARHPGVAGAPRRSRRHRLCLRLAGAARAARGLPNLKAIFSLGAGVDHVVADPDLPDVPVVRIVDPDLTMRMTEYVVLHVLMHHRRQRRYDAQQRERLWREHDQPPASAVAVGVMGLGVLGRDAAAVLRRLGFRVAGWSRTPKTLAGHRDLSRRGRARRLSRAHRDSGLPAAGNAGDARNSAARAVLRKLERDGAAGGAYLINAGRGALQVDADILAALDEGALAGATLDVFATEPLPATSPLWTHPKVTITPHNAAASDPRALVANVLRQIERFEAGLPLEHVIDRAAGY